MKQIKKMFALLLAMCMVLGTAGGAYAETTDKNSKALETAMEEETSAEETSAAETEGIVSEPTEAPEMEALAEEVIAEEVTAEEVLTVEDDETAQVYDAAPADSDEMVQTLSADGELCRAFHLDCGRKYFTVAQIKTILDAMYQNGYNYLELAIGNDGMRFLLDDMAITVNGTSYSSDAVKNAINAGNKAYYDAGTNELTQSEMDEIIVYAKARGIEIIPLVNSPGHCDAILSAATSLTGTNCAYSGSVRTINITNTTAVAFTTAIIQKYITYFAGKGCSYFNMGADEYANDIQSSPQFAGLISSGKYSYFVSYVNDLAAMIKNAGMTPIAFNDGIYYNQTTSGGTFDKDIVISYWSSGWNGYNVASATYLSGKGHKILNTNGDWYYITNQQNISQAETNINKTPYNYVMGSGTMNVVGCMICTWCDTPSYAYNEADTLRQIEAFATANPSVFDTSEKPAVTDKTVNTVWTSDNAVSVTGLDLQSVTATVTTVAVEGASEVAAYDVKPNDSEGAFTASAKVQIKIPAGWNTSLVKGFVVDNGTVSMITGAVSGEYYQFTAPHFSQMGIALMENSEPEPVYDETIELFVGETKDKTINDHNYAGSYTTSNPTVATVTVTGVDAQAGSTVETEVTSVSDGSSYYIKSSDGKYLNASGQFVAGRENAVLWECSITSTVLGTYSLKNGSNYLRYNNGWTTTTSSRNATIYFNNGTFYGTRSGIFSYTYSNPLGKPVTFSTTPAVAAKTDITFRGEAAGTSYVTIGGITYKIIVKKKTETVTIQVNGTTTRTDESANTAVSANTDVATVSANGNTLTFRGVSIGETTVETKRCIYTVKVTAEDLSDKKITIEYWITNSVVKANDATSMTLYATTSTVYSENGAEIKDLVPATGSKASNSDQKVTYWKTTRLASNNKQTTDAGIDKTLAGDDFTRIRYYGGNWAYYDGTTWTNFASDDQIVAYYLLSMHVTDEVSTEVVDDGPVKKDWSGLGYLGTKYVLLDYSVKYESGEEVPDEFTTERTIAYHCDVSTQKNGVYYRSIGLSRPVETGDYEVYMITATPTSDNPSQGLATTAAGNVRIYYNGTETVVWAETQEDLDNSGLGTWTSISGTFTHRIGGEPVVPGMEIYRQQGMKITYYVRAKVTDDALSVKYVDANTGAEFYNYNIVVHTGTTFDENIGLNGDVVVNGSVENSLGKTQTVSADLSTMPAIPAAYRYSNYACTGLVRSADGKTVTLSYTFDNKHAFVVDFGLPLHISKTDLGINGDWQKATVSGAKYGTATATAGEGITYTPNQSMKGVDQLSLILTATSGDTSTQIIDIYPATSVHYEEYFAEYDANWAVNKTTVKTQTASAVKDSKASTAAVYGYDVAYANEEAGSSNGTNATTSTKGAVASFTFTGTGLDIYGNSTTTPGSALVTIKKGDKVVKIASVQIVAKNGTTAATADLAVNNYSTPIYTCAGLERDSYTVTVKTMSAAEVSIDGFRVYGTLAEDNAAYVNDLEDNPSYIRLRNAVIAAYKADATGTYNIYTTDNVADATVAFIGSDVSYDATMIEDLLKNGPKNELFLQPGQAITFSVTTARQVQIGLRAVNAATSYTINGVSKNITTSTDMFYPISSGQTIIKNTGSAILSITKLKVCDEVTLDPLTDADIENAIAIMNAPAEPEVTYSDCTLGINLVDYTGKVVAKTALAANGITGEMATFEAADIQAAAQEVIPAGYAFVTDKFADAQVVYGEVGAVTVQVGKTATLNIIYKKNRKEIGRVTLVHVQTSRDVSTTFTTTEIKNACPSGNTAISLLGTKVNYGSVKTIHVTCR